MSSDVEIQYQQFILIKVNEDAEPASGCSLDHLNEMMRETEQIYNLGIFDRMKACFLENNEVKTLKLQEFRAVLKNKTLSPEIRVFDFSKSKHKDFVQSFLLPLNESWAKDY